MSLISLGVNHHTAPVAVREQVVFDPTRRPEALGSLIELPDVQEAAILSTCNRTEIYCRTADNDPRPLADWLHDMHKLRPRELNSYLFRRQDSAAVQHIMRVACGLDSLVVGEPQILGQVKTAYYEAKEHGAIGQIMGRLFQNTFSVAKRVRTDTAIGASPVSVAYAAVRLAKQIFGELKGKRALLIGAGETIELAARHLVSQHVEHIVVANRSVDRAHNLAQQVNGVGVSLGEVTDHLASADIVISSTGSPLPILGKGAVERALKKRRHRPMFFVDIAVPRDIEPEVGHLQDVFLYTVDDLESVIEDGQRTRVQAAHQAEDIIANQVEDFLAWQRTMDAAGTIRDYREDAHRQSDELLARAKRQLAAGRDPHEVAEMLAHCLTNRLLHGPTVQIREACRQGDLSKVDAARYLFRLTDAQ